MARKSRLINKGVGEQLLLLKNNTLGPLTSHHIDNLLSTQITGSNLFITVLRCLITHQYPFYQTEIPSITLTPRVKILPSLSCLSDSNLISFFFYSCSQAAKYLHWKTDKLVSLLITLRPPMGSQHYLSNSAS